MSDGTAVCRAVSAKRLDKRGINAESGDKCRKLFFYKRKCRKKLTKSASKRLKSSFFEQATKGVS